MHSKIHQLYTEWIDSMAFPRASPGRGSLSSFKGFLVPRLFVNAQKVNSLVLTVAECLTLERLSEALRYVVVLNKREDANGHRTNAARGSSLSTRYCTVPRTNHKCIADIRM